jgi:sulfite exporter TauE/SafE
VSQELNLLCLSAVTIALVHTLCGPDHYIPFVAMSRAGGWTLRKTMVVTLLSGLGHVGSSVLLGLVGIALGEMLANLEVVEQARGRAAGWLMTVFGLIYVLWSIVHSIRHRRHVDPCLVDDSGSNQQRGARLTPWVLFTIFVFGPCEPLIPLLMYPAARSSFWGVWIVTILFSLTTIATMLTLVVCLAQGISAIRFPGLHRYGHLVAGMLVMFCGMAIGFGL